ncbi:hypothetical protein [Aeromicrobium sp. 50.2.37]|uniref:hypothetical protein n=1 Tax=Aeromicrobium sp. 50.2.37 TaxID=2969305 RepID=UPI0021502EF1|nr:hypothetical protein [Aeromicrobium sp. 50.2.37]MCR4512922.1 hypothetical protein [Aeromicrobium sp. 50.2.37]
MGEFLAILVTAERPRGLDPNIVRPGWLALGIVAALAVAVFFLAKSFARHTKKAAQPWEGDQADDAPGAERPASDRVNRD